MHKIVLQKIHQAFDENEKQRSTNARISMGQRRKTRANRCQYISWLIDELVDH